MKTLLLLRHAKSSWDDPALDDFDRPLSPRGIRAAARVGEHMRREGLLPDHVLCSAAVRAMATWDLLSADWPEGIAVECDRALYHATPTGLLRRLAALPETVKRVMIVGHNPGLHQLAVGLTFDAEGKAARRMGGHFPTAALAVIGLRDGSWQRIDPAHGRLLHFVRPRDLE